ncbi:MAG: MATE family efflux transporter [Oscillospiraceae bacterium]
MAGNLLQQLYNTADTIIVGNSNSQQALSAVGSCASLTALFTALAIGFSVGAGVLISQSFWREPAGGSAALCIVVDRSDAGTGAFDVRPRLLQCGAVSGKISGHAAVASAAGSALLKFYAVGLVFQFGCNIAAAILRALED